MPTHPMIFTDLTDELRTRLARAMVSTWGPVSRALRQHLLGQLSAGFDQPGGLLADPVFEAIFPWVEAPVTMEQLEGELLHPELIRIISAAGEHAFPRARAPYRHQVDAWRALAAQPARSVIISSGTGSGKTEAFMMPVLDDLVREACAQQASLEGVRALFLYPLNALIANQRDRLGAWLAPLHGKVRFCLYNGNTPEALPAQEQRSARHEVMDRDGLRASPPPILVTNPTMLEYMLVRNNDRPILEKSQGKLRWIILDEAHTYIGSQAAELSLQLRRVLHAFGQDAEQVRFVATSATLGDDQPAAVDQLRKFMADVAGIDPARVTVIHGERRIPKLVDDFIGRGEPLPAPAELQGLSAAARYERLVSAPAFRGLRDEFSAREVLTLSQIARHWQLPATRALQLLDYARDARPQANLPSAGDPDNLLPLRAHYFLRVPAGLWACVNPACAGLHADQTQQALDDEGWQFGTLYFSRRDICEHCESMVMPLLLCGRCGTHYLSAEQILSEEGIPLIRPRLGGSSLTFDLFAEPEDELDDELGEGALSGEDDELKEDVPAGGALSDGDGAEDLADHHRGMGTRRLLGGWSDSADEQVPFDLRTGEIGEEFEGRAAVRVPEADGALRCTRCACAERGEGALFRAVAIGTPSVLSVSIPTLLEVTPRDRQGASALPFGGRQTITFTDSRQATAGFSLRTQQNAERAFTRGAIYHTLWRKAVATSAMTPAEVADLKAIVDKLRTDGAANPANIMHSVFQSKQKELDAALAPPSASMSWNEMCNELKAAPDIRWIKDSWKSSFGEADLQSIANLLMLREFLRRPMRAVSMETLGLVALEYPWLHKRIHDSHVPADWKSAGLGLEEWRQLLKICLDFVVRNLPATKVDEESQRWLGIYHRPKALLGADDPAPAEELKRRLRHWPSTGRSTRARIIQMLSFILGLDLENKGDRLKVDNLLDAAWAQLREIEMLSTGEHGTQLDLRLEHSYFGPSVELRTLSQAWLCPVTQRVLDTAIGGISPYATTSIYGGSARCTRIEMPRPPQEVVCEYDVEKRALYARQWLNDAPEVRELRELGVWAEWSDRAIEGGRYFRVAEHSAQQSHHTLTRYEQLFKARELNVLSCSTTMEMGVDIGGLMAVAMNNAPPAPANYRQRAGRAGRRSESAALALTLCQPTPHGAAIFDKPTWAFDTPTNVPRVSLESRPIVQRHVNALLLTRFLAHFNAENLKLNTGWFFISEEDAPRSDEFQQWLRSDAPGRDDWLMAGLARLQLGSALKDSSVSDLLEATAEVAEHIDQRWRSEYEALLSQRQVVSAWRSGPKAQALKSIDAQLTRVSGEYLLKFLAEQAFLPGYGFPSGIVPLVTRTWDDQKRNKMHPELAPRAEKDSRTRSEFPTRALPQALREYAPGCSIILDNKVYQSRGVTLNWKIPADVEQVKEIQAIGYLWQCSACKAADRASRRIEQCPACGAEEKHLKLQRLLTPAGFSTGRAYKPHNRLANLSRVPITPPIIYARDAQWRPLADGRGRLRATPEGVINHINSGHHGLGYAICLECGFACSEEEKDAPKPPEIMRNHYPLDVDVTKRSQEDGRCTGLRQQFKIQRELHLGGREFTDVFELQLNHPEGQGRLDRTETTSLAVALRNALCTKLGVEAREVGYDVTRARLESGATGYSIFYYDNLAGGAGYATQAPDLLAEMILIARQALNCARGCSGACHACLLDYDTMRDAHYLNRHRALEALNAPIALASPDAENPVLSTHSPQSPALQE